MSRASSSWSWRCPGTTRSGTASPSSTPLLFLGTGGCTQSRKLHTCTRLNIIRSSHSMHPFHPWTGVKEVFADIEILYLGSGVQTGGQINPDCGMRWCSHCPFVHIAILPPCLHCHIAHIVLRLRTGGRVHSDWGMCPHCSVGAKPTFVTALNLPLGAAFAYLYLLFLSLSLSLSASPHIPCKLRIGHPMSGLCV